MNIHVLIHVISTFPHKIVNTSLTTSNTSLLRCEILNMYDQYYLDNYFLILLLFRSIDSFTWLIRQYFIQTYDDLNIYFTFVAGFKLAIVAVCILCHVGVWGVFIIFINSFRDRETYSKICSNIWIYVDLAFHNHMVYKTQGTYSATVHSHSES